MIWPEHEACEVLVLSGGDLQRLLERRELIAAMAAAMRTYSMGAAQVPLRTMMALPGETVRILASMPGFIGADQGRTEEEALGAKLVSVFPANPQRGLESHYGTVVL